MTPGFLSILLFAITGAVGTDLHDKSFRTKALAGGASSQSHIVSRSHDSKFPKQPDFEQNLIICNAYASKHPLDIFHVRTLDRLTTTDPIPYKDCREFNMPLGEGDQLDFKAGNLDVGTFYATGLPRASSSLLLIPHRRDGRSAAISFESHAFTDLQSPQIAVVDAYKGSSAGTVKMMDLPEGSKSEPVEEVLKFSSVVAVNPGSYKVALTRGTSNSSSTNEDVPLLVEEKAKYVVMRVGMEPSASIGGHYPQELVVYPRSGTLAWRLSMICLALSVAASYLS